MAIRTGTLGSSFTLVRFLQLVFLSIIIGFVGQLASDANAINAPYLPEPIVWILVTHALFLFWCLLTLFLHLLTTFIRYLPTCLLDLLFLPFLIISSIKLAGPLIVPNLDCGLVGQYNHHITNLKDVYKLRPGSSNNTRNFPDGQLYTFSEKPFPRYNDSFTPGGGVSGLYGLNFAMEYGGVGWGENQMEVDLQRVRFAMGDYHQWVGRVEPVCRRMKAAWALTVVSIILVALTILITFAIYHRTQKYPIPSLSGSNSTTRRLRDDSRAGRADELGSTEARVGIVPPPEGAFLRPEVYGDVKPGERRSAVRMSASVYSRPTAGGTQLSSSGFTDYLSDLSEKTSEDEYESTILGMDDESTELTSGERPRMYATNVYGGAYGSGAIDGTMRGGAYGGRVGGHRNLI